MTTRSLTRGLVPSLCVAITIFALAAPANAATTRNLLRTFGCVGPVSAACAVPAPAGSTLSNPQGEAVTEAAGEAGDVYVADTANNRVEKFSATGEFILTFGKDVNKKNLLTPNVCTAFEIGTGGECQKGESGSIPGAFTTAQFVAVDNDASSPSFGDVYVADTGDGIVSKFKPDGELEELWGTKGQLNGFASIAGITVGTTGTLYVLNTSEKLFEFEPDSKPAATPELNLGEAETDGLGVNTAGNLFRVNNGRIREFLPEGAAVGLVFNDSHEEPGEPPRAMTLSANGDLYFVDAAGRLRHVVFNGTGEVEQANGSACPVSPEQAGCEPTDSVPVGFVGSGIAATAGGDVFLSNAEKGAVYEYSAPLILPETEPPSPSEIKAHTVVLKGKIDPEGKPVSECVFQYVEAAKYEAGAANPYEAGGTAACKHPDAAELIVNFEEQPVHAEVSGLNPNTKYDYRLTAASSGAERSAGINLEFSTLPPPSIDSATVTDLTRESAVLNAKINPESSETHYHFEYVKQSLFEESGFQHASRVPACAGGAAECEAKDPSIPAGEGDVFVSAPIGELKANTTYDWRVLATNESGTTTSVQHTFLYPATSEGLPDNRSYELVSPAHKNGAFLGASSILPHIAPDGSRVMANVIQCFAGSQSCTANRLGSLGGGVYAFTRTPGGWVTGALAPPATRFEAATVWGLDAATGDALLSMPTPPALGGNGEDDLYVNTGEGLAHMGPSTPPQGGASGPSGGIPANEKQAETADFSHFAWEMTKPFTFEAGTGKKTVWEYVRPEAGLAGSGSVRPLLVGVSGGEGSGSLVSGCETSLGGTNEKPTLPYPGRMSADGRTVFFTAVGTAGSAHGEECRGTGENSGTKLEADTVYARVDGELRPEEAKGLGVAQAHTVDISDPAPSECGSGPAKEEVSCQKAAAEPPANAEFVGASADGSRAFFLSPQQLTDEASEDPNPNAATGMPPGRSRFEPHLCHMTIGVNGCNLYMYDLGAPEGHSLVDVSAGDSSGEGPRVQGVLALSPDGSHVYFVARGVLSAGANDRGQHAQNGAENLYLYERDKEFPAGRTVFITGLLAGEVGVGDEVEWKTDPGEPANVSPDGRFLVFLSHGDLTADDTSVSGASQVFRYDAVTGRLNRVSIGNNGYNDDGNRSAPGACVHGTGCAEDAGIVTTVEAERSDPSMSDDGSRVFFESPVGLAAGALDDVRAGEVHGQVVLAQNVYEWEQEGVGSCPAGKAAGCVFLISDGRDVFKNESNYGVVCEQSVALCLLGTDTAGRNVFFATADSLVAGDTNTEVDFYDARECTSESPCIAEPPPPLPPCAGEDCHGIPAAAPVALPKPTRTFNGAGNTTPTPPSPVKPRALTNKQKLAKALGSCRKKYKKSKKRRGACEKQAHKAYRATAKKATNHGRAK